MKAPFIKRYVFMLVSAWSLICIAALVSHLKDDYQQSIMRVQTRARTMLERDILYRDWVASHGGVYVPITEDSPPNPHLEFLPERDVVSSSGLRLTLVNPSYMTHQAFTLGNRTGETVSKITSLKFLNPGNAPDDWEKSALQQLGGQVAQVSEVVSLGGRTYLRSMQAFYVESICLRCHSAQGYKLGDVRGGLSISIPLESFLTSSWRHNRFTAALFGLLWLLGLLGIVLLGRRLGAQTRKVIESDRQLDFAKTSLNYVANYDQRTNLPNRFKFEEQLKELFRIADSSGNVVAATVLEIRNYKQIIDNFDHPVGDTLVRMLAERLGVSLNEFDVVARFGEDRLLFSYTCQDGGLFSEDVLQQILAETSKPFILETHEFFPVVCLGTALYPHDSADAKLLVQKALSALMFCLDKKLSGVKFFSQALQAAARDRLDIESGLRWALAENGFELHLQPQVDAISGSVIGAEALLRLTMEGRGNVSPGEFIPVAEESGLILPIGEWVLQTACLQAITLKEKFGRIVPVGVNVSAKQFQDPSFVDTIDEILSTAGMLPEMLEIEITEGTFIEDINRTIEILTDLKVRGLQIAIDDFGTGYSSLSYLKKFPIDRLKIDRSFVADIASDEDDRILASLVAEMARKLGLKVIAEGVEDDAQKNLLIGMGCHAMQGFLFGRAMPLDDFCDRFEAL